MPGNDISQKPWDRNCYSSPEIIKTLPLYLRSSEVLRIPQQTCSYIFYYNLNSVKIKYIPIFPIGGSQFGAFIWPRKCCTRCIPTVTQDAPSGIGMQIKFHLAVT
jgi:hypothetical protein